jgi:hypothetical protein
MSSRSMKSGNRRRMELPAYRAPKNQIKEIPEGSPPPMSESKKASNKASARSGGSVKGEKTYKSPAEFRNRKTSY